MPMPRTPDAVIYLPGIMGSELVDAKGNIVWGMKPSLLFRQATLGDVFRRLEPRPEDGIRAIRPIQVASGVPILASVEPYTALDARLKTVVVAPDAVLPFAYDWRHSIANAAEALRSAARDHLRRWTQRWKSFPAADRQGLPDPRLTLVCHSMGGLVASYFAAFLDDDRMVRKIVTLGTPFGGSLNAVRALATGEQLPLGLFAGPLRDAVRKMPGVYELVARWKCVDALRAVSPADLQSIGANSELATRATEVMDKLSSAFSGDGPRLPVTCLIGIQQPTLQTVRFANGVADFLEGIQGTDERGDGTVFRYAAYPPGVKPMPLPQSHGAVAKTNEAVSFVADVLTEKPQSGFFQAADGIGLRVPDAVTPGAPFQVQVLDGEAGTICQMFDAETNQLLKMTAATKQNNDIVATFTAPQPGLYRIAASGGGFSPIERLVAAIAT